MFRRVAAGTGPPVDGDVPGLKQPSLHVRGPAVGRLFQIDHLLQVAQQVGVADGVGWVQ